MECPARGGAGASAATDTRFLDDASIEATARDALRLHDIVPNMPISEVFVPWLPGEEFAVRLAAVRGLAERGLVPVPHVCARRIESAAMLDDMLARLTREAGVTRLLLIGGDPKEPLGPFADCLSLIRSGALARYGIAKVGLAGHPEGHPDMAGDAPTEVLRAKIGALSEQGIAAEIVTQFSFDPDLVADWTRSLRAGGITAPIAIGIPGPTKVSTLVKFAARCGVGASAKAVAKYGFSLSRLFGSAGPDAFIARLIAATQGDTALRAHFFPFGGFSETVNWIDGQRR